MTLPLSMCRRSLAVALLGWCAAAMTGCTDAEDQALAQRLQTARLARQQEGQSTALFASVVAQLRALPESVPLKLELPVVVLDSRYSSDGEDVLAIADVAPNAEQPIVNYLSVPARNARFNGVQVRPGDTAKYYVVPDKETRQRQREVLGELYTKARWTLEEQELAQRALAEIDPRTITFTALDCRIAQVLTDNSLLLETPLTAPQQIPSKLEIWRTTDARMRDIDAALVTYIQRREPALGWEPSGDAPVLQQSVERLNQWLRQGNKLADWRPSPLAAGLSAAFTADSPIGKLLAESTLGDALFTPDEGRLLQEATWQRDLGRWICRDEASPLKQAERLFDWTVRNLMLQSASDAPPRRPWQAILHGRATAAERSWVFLGLCQQRGLPAAIVSLPVAEGEPWLWCGVVVGSDLHLFDPQLGLPVAGDLAAPPATLAQVKADEGRLRALDLDDWKYPPTAELARAAELFVVAEPFSLARRAASVEIALAGEDALKLVAAAPATIDAITAAAGGKPPSLWRLPSDTLARQFAASRDLRSRLAGDFIPYAWRPALWKARSLHVRGRKVALRKNEQDALAEPVDDHADALALYMDRTVRPPNTLLEKTPDNARRAIHETAKIAATYWVGVLQFEEGRLSQSRTWLENECFANPLAESWRPGVAYNLARAWEADGQADEAAKLLETDESPQKWGNRVRARALRASLAAAPANATSAEQLPPVEDGDP